jgi:DeoR/GlpR family transcriptional regulator of sugar metabolism
MFADVPEITVISLGGVLRRSEMSLIGHLTEQSLRELRADKVIFGVRAVDPEQGLMNDYLPETMTDRVILSIGREVIVVADHTKCNRIAPVLLAPLSAIHTLVTDTSAPAPFIAALKRQGLRVLQV